MFGIVGNAIPIVHRRGTTNEPGTQHVRSGTKPLAGVREGRGHARLDGQAPSRSRIPPHGCQARPSAAECGHQLEPFIAAAKLAPTRSSAVTSSHYSSWLPSAAVRSRVRSRTHHTVASGQRDPTSGQLLPPIRHATIGMTATIRFRGNYCPQPHTRRIHWHSDPTLSTAVTQDRSLTTSSCADDRPDASNTSCRRGRARAHSACGALISRPGHHVRHAVDFRRGRVL